MSTTTLTKPTGFTVTMFPAPFTVIAFPNSNHFEPTPCMALGVETCNVYGGKRLIVRYDSVPRRKVSGTQTPWPDGLLYLAARDVSGWEPSTT